MSTLFQHRIQAAQQGKNPTMICKMPSGWAVLGDQQFIPGYSLLLADPVVPDLNALTGLQRAQFLGDMAMMGDALLEVTGAYRINYEILGNTEPFLHAHILPRYLTEPDGPRAVPVWMGYNQAERDSRPFDVDRDSDLIQKIAAAIQRRM
jgi:diadenosine tetraphosphate (Ap4A) HIT family hydrolase